MTLSDKLKQVAQLFSKLEAPVKEAEILLSEALGISKAELHSSGLAITEEDSDRIDRFASRRLKGEPMNYITGRVEFHGLRIQVGKGVLIPRPETELMVEEAVKLIKKKGGNPALTILDLCTGSGCIALALADMLPQAVVSGIDNSDIALLYARENAEINEAINVAFIKGDLFGPVGTRLQFDCIISNPPYIRRSDIEKLQIEIRDYEPKEALDGGEDGLNFYRRIICDAPRFLKDDGMLILEIGMDQADDVRQLAMASGFGDIQFIKDYSGMERIFVGRK